MEKQLENPTQNQDKSTGKPNSKNQSKLTGKPNPKTVQTHWKTQPKPYSMENSHEMPNEAGSVVVGSSIATARSSIAVVGWGWEAKGRWWRREGGVKERGRAKAKGRPNRLMAEAAVEASWE